MDSNESDFRSLNVSAGSAIVGISDPLALIASAHRNAVAHRRESCVAAAAHLPGTAAFADAAWGAPLNGLGGHNTACPTTLPSAPARFIVYAQAGFRYPRTAAVSSAACGAAVSDSPQPGAWSPDDSACDLEPSRNHAPIACLAPLAVYRQPPSSSSVGHEPGTVANGFGDSRRKSARPLEGTAFPAPLRGLFALRRASARKRSRNS